MLDLEILKKVGLTGQEIAVYGALLKNGPSSAAQLSEITNIHRTNIYSILIKLKNKGFVGEFKEKETLFFKVTDPKNIIDFVKEVEKTVLDKVPELNEYYTLQKRPFDVEVFRGPEGMKTVFNHILREEKPVCGFVLSGKGRKNMPMYFRQWARDIERKKIDVRYVYVEGISKLWRSVKVRVLPKEYMSPVETEVYSDYVIINMWEPMLLAIRINSKEIADAYRKYFEFIWAIAKSKSYTRLTK